jgi:hypothetical protein
MLSPNATNRVNCNCGITSTTTVNEQRSVRCKESVATHVVVDRPRGNVEPLVGVQVTDTGACPPVSVGAGYETAMLAPVVFAD